jgi:transposase
MPRSTTARRSRNYASAPEEKLVFLPPYSPNLNPIEEFFGDLKHFMRRNWVKYESNLAQDFGVFLDWCISAAGGRVDSAKAHFRHAGVTADS